jgi:hypothetical protein
MLNDTGRSSVRNDSKPPSQPDTEAIIPAAKMPVKTNLHFTPQSPTHQSEMPVRAMH